MSERLPGAYLLLGPEEGEKTAFIEKLTKDTAARSGAPDVYRFHAFEAKMSEVALSLRNKSLFSRHRIVIVGDAELIKRKDEVDICLEYLKNPASDATLVLASAGFKGDIDRRLSAAFPADSLKIFWEMYDSQKKGWVVNFFRQRKIGVDPAAVDYLLDMVENNTRDMRSECERLAIFFGEGATIGLEDVEQYLYHSKEENVFTLFAELCARDFPSAEEVLEKILLSREAEPVQLVGGLLAQFRKLASYGRLLGDNYEPAEAFPKLRILSKRNQKTYVEGNRNYTPRDIESIILVLAEFDARFRSFKADLHDLLLKLLVYYIVRRAGQGAWQLSL